MTLPSRPLLLLCLLLLIVPMGSAHGPDFPVEVCPCPPPLAEVPPPQLVVKVCVPACANAHEELDYRILVENRSPTAAHHVAVHNPLPANARFVRAKPEATETHGELCWKLGSIEGCGKREICLTLAPTAAAEIRNCVRLTYEHGVCVCTRIASRPVEELPPEQLPVKPRVVEDRDSTPRPEVGSLSLTKVGPKRAYVGSAITYQLTVTNNGTSPAHNVLLTDQLPPRSTFVSATANGRLVAGAGEASATRVQWSLGTLPAGQSRTVELRLRGGSVGMMTNHAEVAADGGARATAESLTELIGAAGLLMMVVDTRDPIEIGEETHYEIIVRAQGTAPVNNIRITAHVPTELAIVRVQGPVDHLKDGQKVVYQQLNLPAGSDTLYRITVKGLKSGDLRFRAEMTADSLTAGPLLEEESTNVYNPGNGR
jgi:uncharacterized repeat protein (TIGR01451 family)